MVKAGCWEPYELRGSRTVLGARGGEIPAQLACPLYRQAQILARQGITIDRSVLAFWTGYAAAEIKPVWRLMREELLRSTKLFVDETTAPVLDPGRGRTKTGYFWAIARDDRPWQGGAPPVVVYSYAPGRRGDYALALLKGYTGVLQTDGYAGYRALADPKRAGGPATLAFCWAHWRRQFFDLAKSPPAPIAVEALKRIAELYEIEAEIRGKSAQERRAARQEKTKPLVAALKTWLETSLARLAGGSTIAQALRYGLNHWDGLVRFLDDGRIEIDSNTVERSMRPIALNRKNALFAGSDEGAENWAMLASLIETCKLHSVNPEAYLTDVLTRTRQRLAQQTDRRTHALGLGCRTLIGAVKPFRGGHGSSLTLRASGDPYFSHPVEVNWPTGHVATTATNRLQAARTSARSEPHGSAGTGRGCCR